MRFAPKTLLSAAVQLAALAATASAYLYEADYAPQYLQRRADIGYGPSSHYYAASYAHDDGDHRVLAARGYEPAYLEARDLPYAYYDIEDHVAHLERRMEKLKKLAKKVSSGNLLKPKDKNPPPLPEQTPKTHDLHLLTEHGAGGGHSTLYLHNKETGVSEKFHTKMSFTPPAGAPSGSHTTPYQFENKPAGPGRTVDTHMNHIQANGGTAQKVHLGSFADNQVPHLRTALTHPSGTDPHYGRPNKSCHDYATGAIDRVKNHPNLAANLHPGAADDAHKVLKNATC